MLRTFGNRLNDLLEGYLRLSRLPAATKFRLAAAPSWSSLIPEPSHVWFSALFSSDARKSCHCFVGAADDGGSIKASTDFSIGSRS